MDSEQTELREYLRSFLAARDWKIDVLASRADVGRSTLYNFMAKGTSLGSSVLSRIAPVMGVAVEELYAMAGIPVTETRPRSKIERQMMQAFSRLSDEDQEKILLFVKALGEDAKRESNKKDTKRNTVRGKYQEP